MVNLKVLVAYSCDLNEFPIAITWLPRLEWLDLRFNKGIERVPDEIGNMHNLKALHLYGCGLTEMSAALWTLNELNMGSNPLTALPRGIGTLSKLKSLDLSNSSIRTAE
eukprot:TRINITY_DN7456_c1_g4_i1.p2 TRINITY_DN7456_c1_g4~~TRINITY_DN7456_c1_g4_i1.p2  ORF type:complete len:109 (+),score=23.02 TRINITY_DN7456_c1_g4_i1:199-525(+)